MLPVRYSEKDGAQQQTELVATRSFANIALEITSFLVVILILKQPIENNKDNAERKVE